MSFLAKLKVIKNSLINVDESSEILLQDQTRQELVNLDDDIASLLLENEDVTQVSLSDANFLQLIFCIDISGSMAGTEEDIILGLEDLINKHHDDHVVISVILFNGDIYKLLSYESIKSAYVPHFTASGATNLNGCLYSVLNANCKQGTNLLVTISDGSDTEGIKCANEVKELMKKLSNKNNHFYFLGEPNEYQTSEVVFKEAQKLGFKDANISVFTRKEHGNLINFEAISKMISDLLMYGTISSSWSSSINEHYLRITKGRK